MSGKRCQVCDGPVVNGRCKLCGMPYKNDEILYHLNENRDEHYRHASLKAKAAIRRTETPLGDPVKKQKQTAKTARAENQARQQQIRKEAEAHIRDTKVPTGGSKTSVSGKTTRSTVQKPPKSSIEKKKRSSAIIWFVVLIMVVAVLPDLIDNIREVYEDYTTSSWLDDYDEDKTHFTEIGNGKEYILGCEYGMVFVGEDIKPGTYQVCMESGEAVLVVEYPGDEPREYHLSGDDTEDGTQNGTILILREGDEIYLSDWDEDAVQVYFRNVKNN